MQLFSHPQLIEDVSYICFSQTFNKKDFLAIHQMQINGYWHFIYSIIAFNSVTDNSLMHNDYHNSLSRRSFPTTNREDIFVVFLPSELYLLLILYAASATFIKKKQVNGVSLRISLYPSHYVTGRMCSVMKLML